MTKLQLAKRVASIIVYGHIALFLFGLVVALIGATDLGDMAQLILMGSPLLAMVALSAYRFIAGLAGPDDSEPADPTWVGMSMATSAIFILALALAYSVALFKTSISPETLKLIVGAIETVLGAYLGINRDVLFPEKKTT